MRKLVGMMSVVTGARQLERAARAQRPAN
jgi:hypothetical protein